MILQQIKIELNTKHKKYIMDLITFSKVVLIIILILLQCNMTRKYLFGFKKSDIFAIDNLLSYQFFLLEFDLS